VSRSVAQRCRRRSGPWLRILPALADAGLKASTIARRRAAIAYVHKLASLKTPTVAEPVRALLPGIRRKIGAAVARKMPVTAKAIAGMLRRIPDTAAPGQELP
jgi:hypothetical protein